MSINGSQKMSVGVFPFMLQLLVYVREKYKKLFESLQCLSNTSCEEQREEIVCTEYVIY